MYTFSNLFCVPTLDLLYTHTRLKLLKSKIEKYFVPSLGQILNTLSFFIYPFNIQQ